MARWNEVVYAWPVEHSKAEHFPLEDPPDQLRENISRWLNAHLEHLPDLQPSTAAEHLGFEAPHALEVVGQAERSRLRLERQARDSESQYLFHQTDLTLVPVGYTTVRRKRRVSSYWLVGRGAEAFEIAPEQRPDPGKYAGWLGLGVSLPLAYEEIVRTLLASQALPSLPFLNDNQVSFSLSAALLVVGFGALGIARQDSPVRTLGIFHETGRPTAWLTCLAYLGSYLGELRVLDRDYTTHTARLLGTPRPSRRSESLSVELRDGRRLFLIEIAEPQHRDDKRLSLLLAALDAALVLRDDSQAGALAKRLAHLAETPKSLARRAELPIAEIVLAPDAEHTEATSAALPLEAIRRAFADVDVDGSSQSTEIDWRTLFEHLWRPVAKMLQSPSHSILAENP